MGGQRTNRGLSLLLTGLLVLAAALGGTSPGQAALRPPQAPPEYRLQVSFDIPRKKILGQATILAPPGRKLSINPGELSIKSLEHNGKRVLRGGYPPDREIVLYPRGPIKISYEVDIKKTDNNTVAPGDILLNGMWYPTVEGFCRFRLTAVLPAGYQAVSEAEQVSVSEKNGQVEFRFDFPYPLHDLDGINLAASNRFVVSHDSWNGIELLTYLFPEERHLAPRYLERAKRVLEKGQRLLGPFPYRRLALVETLQDGTTQALPTFILMERQDFLLEEPDRTPLDHEIVHQWFGCAVSADYSRGNWCEGMAIYFADHLLLEEKGQGWQCRRRILSGFQSLMQRSREFPLRDFTERFDNPSRVLGYGKGAMVIHMLRRQLGDQRFSQAVRLFLKTNLFGVASWQDLQKSCETVSHRNLSWFFRQWVDAVGQPQIRIDKAVITKIGQEFRVNLTLGQGGLVKRLSLPVRFSGPQGSRSFQVDLCRKTELFSFRLDFKPEKVIIDENYDVFRKLTPDENPPTLERLLATPGLRVVPPPGEKERYREVISKFTSRGARLLENPTQAQLQSASLIILGRNNPGLTHSPDEKDSRECPVVLKVRPQLQSPRLLTATFLGAAEASPADLEKIFAFPFYSTYCLNSEKQIFRSLIETQPGIRVQLPYP